MIQIIRNRTQTGIKDYVCDVRDDLFKIDLRTTLMGSTCYVIEESKVYILNSSKSWVLRKDSGSSSAAVIPGDENIEVDMDGGQID